ncbi:MAG: TfoX/Sxy family protein [Alphaproteobacteria bacterium]|nr:TfoX/Sxy family protein [Alphaproteobacteria bacterium]
MLASAGARTEATERSVTTADPFVAHCLELLAPLGSVTARRMFGGHGLYCDGVMLALVADDMLYLKVDDANRGAHETAGLPPFTYVAKGRQRAVMSYYQPPLDALDDAATMRPWAEAALAAARRARLAKPKPERRARR